MLRRPRAADSLQPHVTCTCTCCACACSPPMRLHLISRCNPLHPAAAATLPMLPGAAACRHGTAAWAASPWASSPASWAAPCSRRTATRAPCTHARARAHAHMHARMHAHMQAHVHTCMHMHVTGPVHGLRRGLLPRCPLQHWRLHVPLRPAQVCTPNLQPQPQPQPQPQTSSALP